MAASYECVLLKLTVTVIVDLCVLFSIMAQHKVGEWVRPEDVLRCVKKHRLFPQAEASIRLHIPDIQKRINLRVEVRL